MPDFSAEVSRRARFFREVGYLRVLNVLESDQTATLRAFVTEESAKEAKVAAAGRVATKLYGLYNRQPAIMHALVTVPKMIREVTGILGPNVVLVKNRHNHATINDAQSTQKESRLHRDILQPSRGLLTAVVYLEDSSPENGCTAIIPGSQRFDNVGVPQQDGGGTWMDGHEEFTGLADQALPVPMPEGSVLLFDGLAFHTVSLNATDRTRMSITLGFRSVDELSKQPDLDREVLVAGEYLYRGNDTAA